MIYQLLRCVCDNGYSGDGYSCEDIDECSRDPTLCKNGKCINYGGIVIFIIFE